jgi:hypothetical protein
MLSVCQDARRGKAAPTPGRFAGRLASSVAREESARAFVDTAVDWQALRHLTEQDLWDLGVLLRCSSRSAHRDQLEGHRRELDEQPYTKKH